MNKQLSGLMQKEMSRKEFLSVVGFGILSIFGFSTVLQLLGAKGADTQTASQGPMQSGFGSGTYGGR